MEIKLEHIGRRFNREWIFRGIDYTFADDNSYAVLGRNGSGKSTLLQIIAGSLTPSEGSLTYSRTNSVLDIENIYRELSIAAPYLELIEELSLTELLEFHSRFKPFRDKLTTREIIGLLGFEKSKSKALKYFSSGMKQRTKLALAFCSETPVLLLDEPTANLDKQGFDWYLDFVGNFTSGRIVIVCSNQEHEYAFCQHHLNILDYKDS